jgi:cytochrome oxidase Cu insertion factor (SCO1/SenC/PrrC family)
MSYKEKTMRVRLASALVAAYLLAVSATVPVAAQAPAVNLESRGPQAGAQAPPFSGVDQQGRTQTLETVMKADGAMIVFYRSADW